MAKKFAKRFYKEVATIKGEGGWLVQLDGRTLKTPGKMTLLVPSEKAAQLIAAEWDAQTEFIRPETMPVTRLLNVAVEHLHNEEQAAKWDPILAWAAEQGVELKTTDSLMAIEQDEAALEAVADFARSLADMPLTLFVHLVAVFGSAILSMAVMKAHVTGEQAYELSRLDEVRG